MTEISILGKKITRRSFGIHNKTCISKLESTSVRRDEDFELFNIQNVKVHLVVKAWSWRKNKICNKMGGPCTCLAIQDSTIL
jgi:hypothetical protein